MQHFLPKMLHLVFERAVLFLATVISVSDGDTLTVLKKDKQQVKIRLAEIDAPEKGHPFGTQSKQMLSDLCFGKKAKVIPHVKDQYGRTVAHVSCEGIDANAEQVSRGMAWVYRKYAKDHNLFLLEYEAKRYKRGLWADKSPTPPCNGARHRATPLLISFTMSDLTE